MNETNWCRVYECASKLVWQKSTEGVRYWEENQSAVLLSQLCSVFCTMRRLMTGCFCCTSKPWEVCAVTAEVIIVWLFFFPPVYCVHPRAQWQGTLDTSAILTLSCSLIPVNPCSNKTDQTGLHWIHLSLYYPACRSCQITNWTESSSSSSSSSLLPVGIYL